MLPLTLPLEKLSTLPLEELRLGHLPSVLLLAKHLAAEGAEPDLPAEGT